MERTLVNTEINPAQALADELIRITAQATGCKENFVSQFLEPACDHLFREYGGERLPKVDRIYPVKEIQQAVIAGENVRAISRRYSISVRTIYRLMDIAA